MTRIPDMQKRLKSVMGKIKGIVYYKFIWWAVEIVFKICGNCTFHVYCLKSHLHLAGIHEENIRQFSFIMMDRLATCRKVHILKEDIPLVCWGSEL